MALTPSIITPDWPAPRGIRACATTRVGGLSLAPYDSFNLAEHTGDDPAAVRANRNALYAALDTGASPRWLEQQHGVHVIDPADADASPQADGSCTSAQGVVCAVLTADCLPVLLCDRDGTRVAALHCGWRGIARGIIEAGIAAMQRPSSRLLAWLGPAIGPAAYEVGEEVRQAFTALTGRLAAAFQPTPAGRWILDLTGAARMLLEHHGIEDLYGGEYCTYTEADRFFSHRRDGLTGRMATCIWLEAPSAAADAELPPTEYSATETMGIRASRWHPLVLPPESSMKPALSTSFRTSSLSDLAWNFSWARRSDR